MNRKQKRDWLRASKGQGNDVDYRTQASRAQRKSIFGGVQSFGQGLKNHFDTQGKGI